MQELHQDIVFEILLRLPAKSLGRFRLVSKTWNSLISNPKFIKSHAEFSQKSPKTLLFQRDDFISSLQLTDDYASISTIDIDTITPLKTLGSIPLNHQLPYSLGGNNYFVIGSCHGIVCIHIKTRRRSSRIYLWNPTTNEHKRIPLPITQKRSCPNLMDLDSVSSDSWFGYVPSLDDYKILFAECMMISGGLVEQRIHIYSLRDAKWREIKISAAIRDMLSQDSYNGKFKSMAVVMNESLHIPFPRSEFIRKFDLVTETYQIVHALKNKVGPVVHRGVQYVISETLLEVIEEKHLCACNMYRHTKESNVEDWMYEFWMLERYDEWDSWKLLYKIELGNEIDGARFTGFASEHILLDARIKDGPFKLIPPFWMRKLTRSLMRSSGCYLELSNFLFHPTHSSPYFKVDTRERQTMYVVSYVESLISLNY